MLIYAVAPEADPDGVERAYHQISGALAGVPGLLGNELLREVGRDEAKFVVLSEWESMSAFQRWEQGAGIPDDLGRDPGHDALGGAHDPSADQRRQHRRRWSRQIIHSEGFERRPGRRPLPIPHQTGSRSRLCPTQSRLHLFKAKLASRGRTFASFGHS